MDNIFKRKIECWNKRLKECMDNGGYTQTSFADALNEKYGKQFGQKDVSRWQNSGAKHKNGEIGFPKYETMALIADFFGVDVGYLTGETNCDSFSLDKACAYMGMNSAALKAIREITSPDTVTTSLMIQDVLQENRDILNMFFTAENFANFFNSLTELKNTSSYIDQTEKRVFANLDAAIDYKESSERSEKLAHYELNEAFILLMNEMYPYHALTNLICK